MSNRVNNGKRDQVPVSGFAGPYNWRRETRKVGEDTLPDEPLAIAAVVLAPCPRSAADQLQFFFPRPTGTHMNTPVAYSVLDGVGASLSRKLKARRRMQQGH